MDRLNAEEVYKTLIDVESVDANVRKPAETRLQEWETGSTKGFLASLTEIIERVDNEQVRLLACIVAKNAVGSSWRKTLSTREWTKVDLSEKEYLRKTLPELLQSEPNNQVALQIALFLSNIVRFDFPRDWPDILQFLVSRVVSSQQIETKYRNVLALKNIFKALQTKVTLTTGFSIEAVQTAVKEAREMPQKVAEQFSPLVDQFKIQIQEFASAKGNWKLSAEVAIELLSVIENSIILLPDLHLLKPSIDSFFTILLEVSQAQFQLLLKSFEDQYLPYYLLIERCFFKNANCVLSTFEKHTMKFSSFVLPFVKHYTEVLATFPRSSRFFKSKNIMKLTRFLTMVMICPFYRHQFWTSLLPILDPSDTKFVNAKIVYEGLNEFFNRERLGALIESLVQNHLSLTLEEIECWKNEPELFLKEDESPESIHSYAEELLIALFIRSHEEISSILIDDVRKLQQHPNIDSDDIVFLLDGCYRAIGNCRSGDKQVVDINQWYESELRSRIEKPEECKLFRDRVLLHRGLWLIRTFSSRVSQENSERIILSVLRCINSSDLVVSMQAIRTLHSFMILQQRRVDDENQNNLPIGEIVKECFLVLHKLKETENRVHILDLVSQLIRIVGYRMIEPHLEEIIGYLPALWSNLPSADGNGESGGEVRLQKSLITLTSNLIQAIGTSALENPKVGELALSLLQFTTNPKGQQALNMLEDGVELWLSILRATPSLAPVLVDLYPRLFEILHPDMEPMKALPILEAYVLLGTHLIPQFGTKIVDSLDKIIGRCGYQESVLAAKIIEVIVILLPDDAPNLFINTLRRMTRDLVEGEAIDRINTNKKKLVPTEAIASSLVIARIVIKEPIAFSSLCHDNVEAQQKLLDRWLGCISNHSIDELFSTYASLSGLQQRKIISVALLILIENNHPVICENVSKILLLIRAVAQQTERLSDRLKRFRELQLKSQLDRPLEIRERDLALNDPIEKFDLLALFAKVIEKYPIPDSEPRPNYLPILDL